MELELRVFTPFFTAAWYDKKAMLDEAREMWTGLTDDQRNDYPEDYFERQIRNLGEYRTESVSIGLMKT